MSHPAVRAAVGLLSGTVVAALLTFGAPSAAAAASSEIKVATWNVCAEACSGLEPWSTRSTAVASSVAYHKPDVLLVQEAGTKDYHARILTARLKARGYALAQGLKARYLYYRTSTMTKQSASGATLTGGVSRVQATSSSKPQHFPWQVLRQRSTSALTMLVDLHLSVGNNAATDEVRLVEMSTMFRRLASREASLKTVYGGDFNSLSHDSDDDSDRCGDYRYRYRADDYLRDQGYLDAVFTAERLLTPAISTYNHNPERTPWVCRGSQIDHLYADSRLRTTTWRTNHSTREYADQLSDHDMVVATFAR